jgi:hypothetical protein
MISHPRSSMMASPVALVMASSATTVAFGGRLMVIVHAEIPAVAQVAALTQGIAVVAWLWVIATWHSRRLDQRLTAFEKRLVAGQLLAGTMEAVNHHNDAVRDLSDFRSR